MARGRWMMVALVLVAGAIASCDKERPKRDRDDGASDGSSTPPARRLTSQCADVIETVNTGSTLFAAFDDDPKKADEQAKKMEEFEKTIAKVDVSHAELKKHVADYRKMVLDMAQLTRDLGAGKHDGIDKRSAAITKSEDELVKKINGLCEK